MPLVKGRSPYIDEDDLYNTDPFYKELDERFGTKTRDFTLPAEEPDEDMTEFGKGFGAGVDQLQALGGGAKAAVGSLFGFDDWTEEGLAYYQDQLAEARQYVPETTWEDDWGEGELTWLGDFSNWLSFTAGNVLPSIATSIAGGGLTGFAAKKTLQGLVKSKARKAAEKKLEEEAKNLAKKQLSKEAQQDYFTNVAKKYATRVKAGKKAGFRGSLAGGFGVSSTLGTGENFGRIYEETGLEEPGTAISFGIAMGALDVAGAPFRAFKKMFPDKSMDGFKGDMAQAALDDNKRIKKMFTRALDPETRTGAGASEILKSGALEAITEATQEWLSRTSVVWAADNLPEDEQERFIDYLSSADAFSSYAHAAAAGAVGGGFIGGPVGFASGPSQEARQRRETRLAETGEQTEETQVETKTETPKFNQAQEENRRQAQTDARARAAEAYDEAATEPEDAPVPESLQRLREETLSTLEFEVAPTVETLAEANQVSREEQQEVLDILESEGLINKDVTGSGVSYSLIETEQAEETAPESPREQFERQRDLPENPDQIAVGDPLANLSGMERERARFDQAQRGEESVLPPSQRGTTTAFLNPNEKSRFTAPVDGEATWSLPTGLTEETRPSVKERVDQANTKEGTNTQQPFGEDEIVNKGVGSLANLLTKITRVGGGRQAPKNRIGGKPEETLQTLAEYFNAQDIDSSNEVAMVTNAILDVVDRGLPREALDGINNIFVFTGANTSQKEGTYAAMAFDRQTNSILINKKTIDDALASPAKNKEMVFLFSHEMYHGLDFNTKLSDDMVGMRLEIQKTANGEIFLEMEDIAAEMFEAYQQQNDLGKIFNYPFDMVAHEIKIREDSAVNRKPVSDFVKHELFAQAGATFVSNPKLLKKFAPKTYKMMLDIQRDPRPLRGTDNETIQTGAQEPPVTQRTEVPGQIRAPPVDRGDEVPVATGTGPVSGTGSVGEQADTGMGGPTQPDVGDEAGRPLPDVGEFDQIVVSTRFPTSKFKDKGRKAENLREGSSEDPVSNVLVNTYESFVNSPIFNGVVKLVRKYNNLTQKEARRGNKAVSESLVEHAKNNLLYLFDSVPQEIRDRSKQWYVGANRFANDLIEKYSSGNERPTLATVSAVIANLSPQKDWYMNASVADRTMQVYLQHQADPFDDKMKEVAQQLYINRPDVSAKSKAENTKYLSEIGSRSIEEIQADNTISENKKNKLIAVYVRTWDQTYNDRSFNIVSPEGDILGKAKNIDGSDSRVAWGSFSEISKAISVLRNPSQENISRSLGDMNKVRNFYNNIYSPESDQGFVTIDTHAVAASLLKPLSGNGFEVYHNFGGGNNSLGIPLAPTSSVSGHKGTYSVYEEAYRRAAKERNVLPREMQSITWEAIRGLFTPGYKAQEENIQFIESIWDNYRRGRIDIDEARSQINDHAGSIRTPDWVGPDNNRASGRERADNEGELSGESVPRQDGGPDQTDVVGGRGDDTGVLATEDVTPTRPPQDADPVLEQAVRDRIDRNLTAGELNEIMVEQGRPVRALNRKEAEQIVTLPSDEKVINALFKTGNELKQSFFNAARLEDGDRLGARLDIPSYSNLPEAEQTNIVTIHEDRPNANKGKAGKRIGYQKTVRLKFGEFSVTPKGAINVGTGKTSKAPFATIEGEYVNATDEENLAAYLEAIDDPAWTQVSMNPRRHSHFYTLDNQDPVTSAEEVIQVGNFVIAKNVVRDDIENYDFILLQSGNKPDAMFNLSDELALESRLESKITKYFPKALAAKVVDRFNLWKTVEKAMARTYGVEKLPAEISFRDQENLMHSKVQTKLEAFEEKYIKNIAALAQKFNLSVEQIGAYLLAKHAPERNKRMLDKEKEKRAAEVAILEAQREETDSDQTYQTLSEKIEVLENAPFKHIETGSGITDAQASQIIEAAEQAGTKNQFEEISSEVYKMLDEMREGMVRDGLLDEAGRADWEETYQFYVPLKGFQNERKGVLEGDDKTSVRTASSKGFSIKGPESMKARGRLTIPQNPLLVAFRDSEGKIIRGEKNRAAQRLLKLVESFQSSEWTVYNAKFRAPVDPQDPTKGVMSLDDMKRATQDGVDRFVVVKRGGQDFFIDFKDQSLRRQMLQANTHGIGAIDFMGNFFEFGRKINNFRRKVIINYNPSWGFVNPIRDIETGLAFLLSEQSKKGGRLKGLDLAGKVFKGWKSAYWSYQKYELGKEPANDRQRELFGYIDDYIADGAPTGLATMKDLQELAKDMENAMGPQPLKVFGRQINAPSLEKTRDFAKTYLTKFADVVESFNQSTENAIRLSAYVEARKAGIDRQDAATLAKDLTVNFNRKGEYSSQIDALYLFFNAAVQGNVNIKDALLGETSKGGKAALFGITATRRLAYGLIAFGVGRTMMNIMFAGEDDDGESKYKDYNPFQLQSTAAFTFDGFPGFGLPIPYGWGWFDNIGRLAAEQMMGVKDPAEAAVEALGVTLHHFSPRGFHATSDDQDSLGAAYQAAITLSPDVAGFFMEQIGDVNFFGSPIVLPTPYTDPPASYTAKRGTLELFKSFTQAVNDITGGNSYTSGEIDISPDRLQHMFDFALGGLGRFGTDSMDTIQKTMVPEVELTSSDIPIFRRFFFNPSEYTDQFEYYDNRSELQQQLQGYKAANLEEKRRLEAKRSKFYYTKLNELKKAADRELKSNRAKIREAQDAARSFPLTDTRRKMLGKLIKEKEDRNQLIYDTFNKRYREAK